MKSCPSEPLIGTHVSVAGGISLAIERAERLDCSAMQVFVKNANRWESPDLQPEEIERFCSARAGSNLKRCVAHDSYLINLAAPDDALWDRSREALLAELRRCDLLGLEHLVIHPGAHVGSGESEGIGRIAAAIDWIQAQEGDLEVKIALETTAGQGSSIGHRFEHLRDIFTEVQEPEKLFVCLDTCHIFAAGYDIRRQQDYSETMELFKAIIGLDKLKVIHFNDSKRDLGSRVDRHEHIGKGFIGKDGFRWFLNDPRFVEVPKILETPKGSDDSYDIDNLAVLRSLTHYSP
jgi:deoxyribonuclease-4